MHVWKFKFSGHTKEFCPGPLRILKLCLFRLAFSPRNVPRPHLPEGPLLGRPLLLHRQGGVRHHEEADAQALRLFFTLEAFCIADHFPSVVSLNKINFVKFCV